TIPSPDPGGVDSDGDGVSDALEIAFGASPLDSESLPGQAGATYLIENVPVLGVFSAAALALLLLGGGLSSARRRKAGLLAVTAVILLPLDLLAGAATRIQLVAHIPVPPPMPQLLGIAAANASSLEANPAVGPATSAVDGNMLSRWGSQFTDDEWISLDFGSTRTLTEVIIHWEAANAATYKIQGSSDNINWVTLSTEFGGTFGARTDVVTLSGSYRYMRMLGLTRSSQYGYSIFEMQVYGLPAPEADADADGVSDSSDLCPGTPPGSTVDATGCIVTDSDGDGVPDGSDLCPGTAPGATVDGTGCVIVIPVNEVTSINDMLAGGAGSSQPGLTLYIFDNDPPPPAATSNCNGGCATSWPPLLVSDGIASGVAGLGTIVRSDSTVQATHNGRPLYYYIGDTASGQTNGDGVGGVWHTVPYVLTITPLFDNTTALEPELQLDTGSALITRLADRARDRHAREAQFQQYDHYLSFYWEHRTAEIEIIDTVGHGGDTITFNVITEWPLITNQEELRFFHLNAAVYANNGTLDPVPGLDAPPPSTRKHYTRSVTSNPVTNQPLQVGDRMEFELSQFLAAPPNGRSNYYGTAILYIVGQGVV
ncbi:MAG: discoidin domain-containing protein, partial [Pseudomonadales bacterium]